MKKLIGISLIGLLCGASLALAEDPGAAGAGAPTTHARGPGRHFEEADANHDGKLTKAELQASMQKHFDEHFAKMDANGDGVLTREEMANGFHGFGPGHRHGRGHHECKGDHGPTGDHG